MSWPTFPRGEAHAWTMGQLAMVATCQSKDTLHVLIGTKNNSLNVYYIATDTKGGNTPNVNAIKFWQVLCLHNRNANLSSLM